MFLLLLASVFVASLTLENLKDKRQLPLEILQIRNVV
jgi:hypothetical protein